jgi:hypothetical protein
MMKRKRTPRAPTVHAMTYQHLEKAHEAIASPLLKDDPSVHPSWRDEEAWREDTRKFPLQRFED